MIWFRFIFIFMCGSCSARDIMVPINRPFTFEVENFTIHEYLRVDPDSCGEKFSIAFCSDIGCRNDENVLMNLTFATYGESMGIFIHIRREKVATSQSTSTGWFREPCLYPLKIFMLDGSGKTIMEEQKQLHRPNIRLLTVPIKFAKYHRYRLVMTLATIRRWAFNKNLTAYIKVKDKLNHNELLGLEISTTHHIEDFARVNDFKMLCFTKSADGKIKTMKNKQKSEYKSAAKYKEYHFPLSPDFMALMDIIFVKDSGIELMINGIHYCDFEPLPGNIQPHWVSLEPDSNIYAITSHEWM